ncbi:niacin transporter [Alkalibaculum bacchi]|mgnify:CR=1 FL=1|uniref:Niacin transporter n=1 Tax=Alkalibaculum bacchi TaxID=645887 RepID=A0A366HZS4_9FIRM|nr:hypothetical protein [Alkalibaculum bacchi]RBP59967.1 niacin transporter [Alkalibaculum bacchi]
MENRFNTRSMVVAALLCAIGILIPLVSPIRFVIEPASFTLASHVALFIAVFISPATAVFVSLGTTLGFFLGGFPIVVVARAFSQILFAFLGALYLKKHPNTFKSMGKIIVFAIVVSIIHGLGEILAVSPFYIGQSLSDLEYQRGYIYSIVGMVGIGTFIHSLVDFAIAYWIWKVIPKK